MQIEGTAPAPSSLRRRTGNGQDAYSTHHYFTSEVIAVRKRGKVCMIAKLVRAKPLDRIVLGTPYRSRREVEVVSLPPSAIEYALLKGAEQWIIRLDNLGECYGFPLASLRRTGWLRSSCGLAELFIPISKFTPLAWQDWDYITEPVIVLGEHELEARQGSLFDLKVTPCR